MDQSSVNQILIHARPLSAQILSSRLALLNSRVASSSLKFGCRYIYSRLRSAMLIAATNKCLSSRLVDASSRVISSDVKAVFDPLFGSLDLAVSGDDAAFDAVGGILGCEAAGIAHLASPCVDSHVNTDQSYVNRPSRIARSLRDRSSDLTTLVNSLLDLRHMFDTDVS
jgi:hypothetical protein